MKKLDVSIVLPVYRSANNLTKLVSQISAICKENYNLFEIILVEDGGADGSWLVIDSLVSSVKEVIGIKLAKNFGQHNALLCGLKKAKYPIIVTMDDDGQHPPSEIPKMVNKLEEGYDVVYGKSPEGKHGLLRNCASKFIKKILKNMMSAKSAVDISAFRAIRRSSIMHFSDHSSSTVNIDIMLSWSTSSFSVAEVTHKERQFGDSGYNFRKLLTHTLNMLVGFSSMPLKFASLLGIFFSIIGLLIMLYVITIYVVNGMSVPGFAFISCIICIFSGVQLLTIGIIGEYVGRIYFRSMGKPTYVVEKVISTESKT